MYARQYRQEPIYLNGRYNRPIPIMANAISADPINGKKADNRPIYRLGRYIGAALIRSIGHRGEIDALLTFPFVSWFATIYALLENLTSLDDHHNSTFIPTRPKPKYPGSVDRQGS